jgi:hypothetical protein
MGSYAATVHCEEFAARLETDDLLGLVRDDAMLDELQDLLDRHHVLHLCPRDEITPESMGLLAEHLGMPAGAGSAPGSGPRSSRPGRGGEARPPLSAAYPFIIDFSSPARPPSLTPRPPAYIERLHYDGISACSMQATFDSDNSPPQLFCDMRAAYRSLRDGLKEIVDTRRAVHAWVPHPGTPMHDFPALDPERAARHPLRIRHPRTGDPLLFLPRNPASIIEGLPADEGIAVLAELWAHVESAPVRYEVPAGHNQLLVWDGLGTTHTNPPYPRDRSRRLWFTIVPARSPVVEPWP